MSYGVANGIVIGFSYFFNIVSVLLLVYVILSWITRPYNKLYILVSNLVAPIIAPFRPISRKLIERGFMIDVSVLLALITLRVLGRLVPTIVYKLFGLM